MPQDFKPTVQVFTFLPPTAAQVAEYPRLTCYGLRQHVLELWQTSAQSQDPNYCLARVCADYGQQYRVETETGTYSISAPRVYALDDDVERTVVGDWLVLKYDGESYRWHALLTRYSELARNAAGRRTERQVLAANVDQVWIVMGVDGDFNLPRLERWLAAVWASGAQARVILTKADLVPAAVDRWAQAMAIAPGVEVLLISALSGQGMAELEAQLAPGISLALVGSSGVGKSTLCNALLGATQMRTQAVRQGDDRGRHTTTHRELLLLPQGALLMDGPGIRELQLWADESAVDHAFAELQAQLENLAEQCRFADCQHQQEPACAVQAALQSGELSNQRWQRWLQLRAEVAAHALRRDDAARRAQERRQGKMYQRIQREKRQRRKD